MTEAYCSRYGNSYTIARDDESPVTVGGRWQGFLGDRASRFSRVTPTFRPLRPTVSLSVSRLAPHAGFVDYSV